MLAALKAAAAAAAQEKEESAQQVEEKGNATSQEDQQQPSKSGKTRFPPISKQARSVAGASASSNQDGLGNINAPSLVSLKNKLGGGSKEARTSSPSSASEDTAVSSSGGAKGIMALRRLSKKMSMWGRMNVKKPVKPEAPKKRFENTYRTPEELPPRANFNTAKVETMLNNVLSRELGETPYDGRKAKVTATKLADVMKTKVKMMGFKRHKIVVHVIIGPLVGQGLRIGSRCVWDSKTDGFASANYQNSQLFAVATVYCALYE